MDHRYARPVPARTPDAPRLALTRRRAARLLEFALLAGALALGLGVHETYLDADGYPCERLCPWG